MMFTTEAEVGAYRNAARAAQAEKTQSDVWAPTIAVKAVGRPLPGWIRSTDQKSAFIEVLIAQEHASESSISACCDLGWMYRIAITDHALGEMLPPCLTNITADPSMIDTVAEALVRGYADDQLICWDHSDLLQISVGGRREEYSSIAVAESFGARSQGRADVFEGLASGDSSTSEISEKIKRMKSAGYDGGLLLITLITEEAFESFSLVDWDECVMSAVDRSDSRNNGIVAITMEATRNAIVLITFPPVLENVP